MERLRPSLRGGMGARVDGRSTFESVQMASKCGWAYGYRCPLSSAAETLICAPSSFLSTFYLLIH
jgi:hypothetical protein